MNHWLRRLTCALFATGVMACGTHAYGRTQEASKSHDGAGSLGSIEGKSMTVTINADGSYSVLQSGIPDVVMQSGVEADVNSKALQSSTYPQHKTARSEFHDEFGSGTELTVTHTGLPARRILSALTGCIGIRRGATSKSRCVIQRDRPSVFRLFGASR